jgi:hypothetical protein
VAVNYEPSRLVCSKGADMGTKAVKKKKAQKLALKTPQVVVKVTNIMGEPLIEEFEDKKHIVLWMYVEGHGRIKVQSTSPGVYHASAGDPAAGSAAEAGAEEYCTQHGEQLNQLYGQLS